MHKLGFELKGQKKVGLDEIRMILAMARWDDRRGKVLPFNFDPASRLALPPGQPASECDRRHGGNNAVV